MSTYEPKPPTRRDEKFPKTMTIPEGWITEGMTAGPANGKTVPPAQQPDGNTRPVPAVDDEELLNRRLDPFPRPNTIPGGWDLSTL
jgi:hypothetical protein